MQTANATKPRTMIERSKNPSFGCLLAVNSSLGKNEEKKEIRKKETTHLVNTTVS